MCYHSQFVLQVSLWNTRPRWIEGLSYITIRLLVHAYKDHISCTCCCRILLCPISVNIIGTLYPYQLLIVLLLCAWGYNQGVKMEYNNTLLTNWVLIQRIYWQQCYQSSNEASVFERRASIPEETIPMNSKYICEKVNVLYEQYVLASRQEAKHDVNTEAALILSNTIRFMTNMKFKGATSLAVTTRNVPNRLLSRQHWGILQTYSILHDDVTAWVPGPLWVESTGNRRIPVPQGG